MAGLDREDGSKDAKLDWYYIRGFPLKRGRTVYFETKQVKTSIQKRENPAIDQYFFKIGLISGDKYSAEFKILSDPMVHRYLLTEENQKNLNMISRFKDAYAVGNKLTYEENGHGKLIMRQGEWQLQRPMKLKLEYREDLIGVDQLVNSIEDSKLLYDIKEWFIFLKNELYEQSKSQLEANQESVLDSIDSKISSKSFESLRLELEKGINEFNLNPLLSRLELIKKVIDNIDERWNSILPELSNEELTFFKWWKYTVSDRPPEKQMVKK